MHLLVIWRGEEESREVGNELLRAGVRKGDRRENEEAVDKIEGDAKDEGLSKEIRGELI